jgi:hypothetical protein
MARDKQERRDDGGWLTFEEATTLLGVDERRVGLSVGRGFPETRKADDGQTLYASRDVLRMQSEALLRELRQALGAISPELAAKVETLALVQCGRGRQEANAALGEVVVALERETA